MTSARRYATSVTVLLRTLGLAARAARRAAAGVDWVSGAVIAPATYAALLPGLTVGARVRFRGLPRIEIVEGATVVLGDEVVLNSSNRSYHLNMHSPVKLLADRAGAQIVIGASSRIHGTCIHAYERVEIGVGCLIAANTQIMDGSGHALSFPNVEERVHTRGSSRPVRIGNHVWIGANCLILPGVEIGEGSVIAAGSVVTESIPARVVAAGNPAKVVRDYDPATFRSQQA